MDKKTKTPGQPILNIPSENSFSALFAEMDDDNTKAAAPETTSPEKTNKEKKKKEELDVAVKISLKTKLRIQKHLMDQQRKTGKFMAINRQIEQILGQWLDEHNC